MVITLDWRFLLIGLISGLAAGGVRLLIYIIRKRNEANMSAMLDARIQELKHWASGQDASTYPHQVPDALVNHKHVWHPTEDRCVCGAYRDPQTNAVSFWTRGQVVVIDGQLRQVLGYNISNTRCLHYIVNGFEPNEEGDHTRHYGPHQLAEATKESELR